MTWWSPNSAPGRSMGSHATPVPKRPGCRRPRAAPPRLSRGAPAGAGGPAAEPPRGAARTRSGTPMRSWPVSASRRSGAPVGGSRSCQLRLRAERAVCALRQRPRVGLPVHGLRAQRGRQQEHRPRALRGRGAGRARRCRRAAPCKRFANARMLQPEAPVVGCRGQTKPITPYTIPACA